jgi:hypothetical protein
MFYDNSDFFPTPKSLVFKMLAKLQADNYGLNKCKYILEPSAGKGDIIKAYKEYYLNDKNKYNSKYSTPVTNADKYIKFDVIEYDKTLNSLLRGEGYNVIWDDYLTFDPPRFYDLIIQNVPFSNGAIHLLKSIHIQEVMGGRILCIINAETIKNPYSKERIELTNKLKEYNADIEYIQQAFTDAERKTDVEIALIYLTIPMQNTETMFEREFKRDNVNINSDYSFQSIIPQMNKLQHLVFEFNICKNSIIKLYEERERIKHLFKGLNIKQEIGITDNETSAKTHIKINDYISQITMCYWDKFIKETDFKSKLPSRLRDNFAYNLERQADIPFTIENCRYFYENLMASIPKSYEETVAQVFDTLTSKYSYTDASWNKNIHMYSGWRSNNAYMIKGKNIIPCYLEYSFQCIPDVLKDLTIIFNNLTGQKYVLDTNEMRDKIQHCEKNIDAEFFYLDVYKKGTIHIKYKDENLLRQFNILAGKGKNWIPDSFMTRKYSDMDSEEKRIVKEFGFKPFEYDELVATNTGSYIPLQLN